VIDTQEKQFKRRRDLFWLMISEVSVHGGLVPLLETVFKAEQHGSKSMWQSKFAHLMLVTKQRQRVIDRKWQGTRFILQSHAFSDLLPLTRYSFLIFPSPSYNAIKLWVHPWINSLMIGSLDPIIF
jgi:hypothetical protein